MAKLLCKYDEYGKGMGFPPMKDFFEEKPYEGIDKIIQYLKDGKRSLTSLTIDTDFFTGEALPFSKGSKTDGEFVWSNSLYYYVEKYNLRLPQEFERKVLG